MANSILWLISMLLFGKLSVKYLVLCTAENYFEFHT